MSPGEPGARREANCELSRATRFQLIGRSKDLGKSLSSGAISTHSERPIRLSLRSAGSFGLVPIFADRHPLRQRLGVRANVPMTAVAVDQLLRHAEIAMYQAKQSCRDRVVVADTFALTTSHDEWRARLAKAQVLQVLMSARHVATCIAGLSPTSSHQAAGPSRPNSLCVAANRERQVGRRWPGGSLEAEESSAKNMAANKCRMPHPVAGVESGSFRFVRGRYCLAEKTMAW